VYGFKDVKIYIGGIYMKSNYHTHNYRCNHAEGSIEDYIQEAINAGFDEIGISDHLPHPGKNIDNTYRMKYEELSEYFNEIDETIKEYGSKISIKKGIECEYFEDYDWLYKELREKYKVDYLILGVHFFPHNGRWYYVTDISQSPEMLESYTDHAVRSIKSGIFSYIAHPDLFGLGYINWDEHSIKAARRILKAAEEIDLPIEINVNGLRKPMISYNKGKRHKYPMEDFWSLVKEYDVRVIIGIDAHNPCELHDLDMGLNFAKEFGIEVIDRLDLK
jgi:histidinol-phosphatase (PHP family)